MQLHLHVSLSNGSLVDSVFIIAWFSYLRGEVYYFLIFVWYEVCNQTIVCFLFATLFFVLVWKVQSFTDTNNFSSAPNVSVTIWHNNDNEVITRLWLPAPCLSPETLQLPVKASSGHKSLRQAASGYWWLLGQTLIPQSITYSDSRKPKLQNCGKLYYVVLRW